MLGGARNLLRLAPQRAAKALRTTAVATRSGKGGPDPNAPKWEQAVRRVLWHDEHVVFAVVAGWVVVYYGAMRALKKE
eukprot:CAMPEP_0180145230 /NCGR_PEP_ID=MMETSP0986-20121125/17520_1 /TAXON_ID=697907 /ORGANISM="non described non described, Strain CCMP2293" /LENGTH=77 /DNA_ID=CAMNT_0022089515 /DNA_START=9 /DNA_END=242 /DNA_ORIENTATION=+